VQIMEGQVVNQFKVFVNNADTGMNLSGVVDVVAYCHPTQPVKHVQATCATSSHVAR